MPLYFTDRCLFSSVKTRFLSTATNKCCVFFNLNDCHTFLLAIWRALTRNIVHFVLTFSGMVEMTILHIKFVIPT